MGNGFFNSNPFLGGVFDFNHDGQMNLSEAMAMGAWGHYVSEAFEDDDEDLDEDDGFGYDRDEGVQSAYRTFSSYGSGGYDLGDYGDDDFGDYDDSWADSITRKPSGTIETENRVRKALEDGVRFHPDNIIALSKYIYDESLLVRLIATSEPRFTQEHANALDSHWGSVELEYHHEAFEEESHVGNEYHVSLPCEEE